MLNQLRSSASGIAAKILLTLLILSFAVWGVGDMVNPAARNVAVAEVGGTVITQAALQSQLQREVDNLRRSLGASYSPELVKNLHLPEQVLNRMITNQLVEMEAVKSGLIPSDGDVAQRIIANPAFEGASGKFDKEAFLELLKRNNLSEKTYVASMKRGMGTDLLMQTLQNAPATVPEHLITTLYRALEEKRVAEIYTLNLSSITAQEPTEAEIATYHHEQASRFSTPEYRTLKYVAFNAEEVQKNVEVEEEEMRVLYEERREEFRQPERRTVSQLLFDKEADASKAYELLQQKNSFEEVAKLAGAQGKKPIALGNVERGRILAEAEEDVFMLEAGESTLPIKSGFGWHIFQVSNIEPEKMLTYEEARPTLENDAKQRAAEYALNRLSNELEDALAAGSSLEEAARDARLTVKSAGPVDRNSKTPDGKEASLPALDKFLDVAFTTDEKTESTLTSSKGGDYYIVRVESITPEKLKPLESVKEEIVSILKQNSRALKAQAMASEAADAFASEEGRKEAIAKYGFTPEGTHTLKRSDEETYPSALLADLYDRTPGQSTRAYLNDKGNYQIAVLKQVLPSTGSPSESVRANLERAIADSMRNELSEQYIAYLKDKYHVVIHQDALAAVAKE